jgi:hypothetical protein
MGGSHSSRVALKNPLLNPWFLASGGLFIVHYILQHAALKLPLADAYLDDLLCMPVVLSISLAAMRFLYSKTRLTTAQILFTFIYCSVLFEVFLPMISRTYTGDVTDVVLYALGAWFFARMMNKLQ